MYYTPTPTLRITSCSTSCRIRRYILSVLLLVLFLIYLFRYTVSCIGVLVENKGIELEVAIGPRQNKIRRLCGQHSAVILQPSNRESIPSPKYHYGKLVSLSCAWRSVRVAPKSSCGHKPVKSCGLHNVPSRSLPLASISLRNSVAKHYSAHYVTTTKDQCVVLSSCLETLDSWLQRFSWSPFASDEHSTI